MTSYFSRNPHFAPMVGVFGAGTRTSFALDDAFTLGAAGKCVGIRFVAPVSDTIDWVAGLVDTVPGVAHNLSFNICAYGSAASFPGSLVTNGAISVSGGTVADKWIKATYSSKPSVTQGNVYWLVIGDPAGAVSEYSVLSRAGGAHLTAAAMIAGFTGTNGLSSAGTSVAAPLCFMIKFTNGEYLAQVYTLTATDASADKERGFLITPTEDITIFGLHALGGLDAGASYIKVYEAGQNPGGTIYSGFNGGAAFPIPVGAQQSGASLIFPDCLLIGGNTYRIVQDPNGVATTPGYIQIEGYADFSADFDACSFMSMYGMQHTEENAGAWLDSPDKFPRISVLIKDNPAQAAGAGGNSVLMGS